MEYPKQLVTNIYWAFSEGPVANQEEFFEKLTAYHEAISGQALPVSPDEVIFEHHVMVLQYVKYLGNDDYEEPQVPIQADNEQNFTAKELLYKIHQVGLNLENDDNCYFEGLTFATSDDPDFMEIPVYFLDTGN